ncbi:MAG TPA: ThiF family adenylyltransferase [Candidatus Limnocylindrales bacterium]|nr:ThiF family adenylyltransferase [Candidatus Limnocylindrales bacterium]
MADTAAASGRYARQERYPGIGAAGQARLGAAVVTVVGCGALGSASVNMLARGGVGEIRIIDRDVVELTNLQRQLLFEERDAEAGVPKAVAAAAAVARINSTIRAVPVVADLTPYNVRELLAGSSVVIDGTDNLETRYLLNDACVQNGLPWVYGGVIGSTGMAMAIVPRRTACFRCLFPRAPDATRLETCETAGVLAAAVVTVASFQWMEAVKLIVGAESPTEGTLLTVDVWSGDYQVVHGIPRKLACACCVEGRYDYLDTRRVSHATVLCGRDVVQVSPGHPVRIDLPEFARRFEGIGSPVVNEYLVRVVVDAHELTIFDDGRAIIRGTNDPVEARSLYARWVGA